MKTGTKIIRIVCWGFGGFMIAAGLLRLPGDLAGVYDQSHPIVATVTGEQEDVEVNNRLTIAKDMGRSIAFHAELVGANYHTCDVEGVAEMRPRNPLRDMTVLRFSKVPDDTDENTPCVLDIRISSSQIQMEVVGENRACSYYCGARASLDVGYFERKNRSPLAD